MYCTLPFSCTAFSQANWFQWRISAFSSLEAALLLVSTKNHDLWPCPKTEVRDSRTSRHSALWVNSDKSDWFWSQSIVFTNPFKTGMSLDRARGRDSWCWPKGARPLGTRMVSQHSRPQSLQSFWPAAGIESSGNNRFEITKEITEFCPSGSTQSSSMAHARNGCSQSSRFLPQARRIVGSGDENGYLRRRARSSLDENWVCMRLDQQRNAAECLLILAIFVPRGRDIPVLNGFVNTIDCDQNQSDLSELIQSMRRVTGSPWIAGFRCWTRQEVVILGADQKERGL